MCGLIVLQENYCTVDLKCCGCSDDSFEDPAVSASTLKLHTRHKLGDKTMEWLSNCSLVRYTDDRVKLFWVDIVVSLGAHNSSCKT